MANTKKIIYCLLFMGLLFAEDIKPNSVYFSPETPDLLVISDILEKHDYMLTPDSLTAEYAGDIFYYMVNDSIKCEIQLKKGNRLPFILDTFMKEPEDKKNVRYAVNKFSIWMLILNALTAILFFVRSS